MKKVVKLLSFGFILGLVSCNQPAGGAAIPEIIRDDSKVESATLYVDKVENMPDDFIMGMDISSVISEEESGVKYYNFDGKEQDIFQTVSENGVNYIRVRIWNDPWDASGNSYGGGHNDLATAVKIGKRATANNMKLLVDFHYSDFWADPAKQMIPKAWEGLTVEERSQKLYEYTRDSLKTLRNEGIAVGMVQVGNETNGYLCGSKIWADIASYMASGSKAVREVYPEALVALHFTNPEKTTNMLNYGSKLKYYNVDYDVFGTSYYPYWHGTLDNLANVLNQISDTYNKKTMVMETSYAFTYDDTDFWGNTSPNSTDVKDYQISVAGQANHMRNLTDTMVNKVKAGIGVCYWEGAWITVGGNSWEENSAKWEKYGSGWASSYAKDYDSKDAGKFYGGSAVDNQAFFDAKGKPLESLKVFNLVRYGNNAPEYVDGAEDVELIKFTTDEFELPTKTNVVYNSNRKAEVEVEWESFDLEAAKARGNGIYDIKGIAAGYEVNLHLVLMEKNFIQNYGFENGKNCDPWVVTSAKPLGTSLIASVTDDCNPQTGTWAFHFWGDAADSVNFEVEQAIDPSTLVEGKYKMQLSLMGGKGSGEASTAAQNCYAYVKINGEVKYQQAGNFTKYNAWSDIKLSDIEYHTGESLSVGFHIESSEAGVWGDIDDVMLNFVE